MKRRTTAIEATLAKWRAANEWPLTKAERAVRDADLKAKADAAQAKMDALRAAGVTIALNPTEAGNAMIEVVKNLK
jgi:succinyl-CoA synthetase alpha subunit